MNERTPVARAPFDAPLVTLRRQLEDRAEEFRMVLPSHITPEKLQRTVLTAVQLNPDLLSADRRSFLNSCMKAAQDGLLPDGREAVIVVYKTRVKDPATGQWGDAKIAQYQPMLWGLRKKILQSGEISDLFAAVVYRQEIERGNFVYEEGSERQLRHRPILDPDFAPSDEDIALAYSVATFADGSKSFEVMRRGEINQVRESSQSGATRDAKGQPRESKGPWRDWFSEMAKKTVVRRHAKSLPQSGDVNLRDVEAEDMGLAAARSAVALLDSRQPDAPRQLIQPEPGEGLDEPDEAPAMTEPEINPPAEPEPEPEPGSFDPATGEILDAPELQPEPENPEADEPEPEPEPEPETDDVGLTKTEQEKLAESYIARARRVELLMDLRKLEKEAELDLATMSPEYAACVDTEFENARKRLTPRKES